MKVSVLMPTYNHEPYISEAIESFLAQQTSFEIELLINDDCSTDNTYQVALGYAQKHPQIKLFKQTTNQGLLPNYKFLLQQAQGEYLAVLESDDYWIDENKLQKQVDYLDAHPTCHLSFTGVNRLKGGTIIPFRDMSYLFSMKSTTPYDYMLYHGGFIFSPTVCFRRSAYDAYCNIDDYIRFDFLTFDYPVWLSLMANGTISYDPCITAVYRIMDDSISNNRNVQKRLRFYQSFCLDIRNYIISRYGRGKYSRIDIRLRQAIQMAQCMWWLRCPFRATYYFFATLLGIVHGQKQVVAKK